VEFEFVSVILSISRTLETKKKALPFRLFPLNHWLFGRPLDPRGISRRFVQNFEEKYGNVHPTVLNGTYREALETARRQYRFLLVYLHSESHVDTPHFCRNVLNDERVVSFVDDNFLFWGGDVRETEAYRASYDLEATSFPFVAVLTYNYGSSGFPILGYIDGTMEPEKLIQVLTLLLEKFSPTLHSARSVEEQRDQDRRIREDQDAAYYAALAADQERELQEQLEKERLEEEERQRQELEQQILANSLERERIREEQIQKLKHEPEPGENVCSLAFRLPDGSKVNRRFSKKTNSKMYLTLLIHMKFHSINMNYLSIFLAEHFENRK